MILRAALAFIPGPIRRALAWAGVGIALLWAAWVGGKRDARQEAALSEAEDIARAEVTRGRIDHELDQVEGDVGLVAAAERAGVVRPERKQ